ncbi:MAG: ribosome-associated translation inhibitor RaiA [Candidatus Taylorbacteria bacterium]|nr:ribosome-associated translation inhibitor RaiA [Candidatus Taylorbacteria bacterium]
MNINVKGSNIELTPAISDYISKKLEGVSKFIDRHSPDTVCHVEVGKTSSHHKHGDIFRAEVRVHLKGQEIYVAKETTDLYSAIDMVRDEVMSKLTGLKDKKVSMMRKGGAKVKSMIKGLFGSDDVVQS